MGTRGCYLLHFDRPYKHAGHYLGWSGDITRRVEEHSKGQGARLCEVVHAAGIDIVLVRRWNNEPRATEKKLKARHSGKRLCPICTPPKPARRKGKRG